MTADDKEVVSEVRNALGTTYILVGLVIYVPYFLFFRDTFLGLIMLLVEPIVSALLVIQLKLSKVKYKINDNNWPKVRNMALSLLFLLTFILAVQSFLSIIVHVIASIVIYLYLKP